HDKVVGSRLVILEKVLLDAVALVAKAEDELLVPIVCVVPHHVPKDGSVSDWNHRFRGSLRVLPKPHAQATTKNDDFHTASSCGFTSQWELSALRKSRTV